MQLSCSYNVQIHDVLLMHLPSSGSLMPESCFTSESHEIVIRLPHTARTMQEPHKVIEPVSSRGLQLLTPVSNLLAPLSAHKHGHLVKTTQIPEIFNDLQNKCQGCKIEDKTAPTGFVGQLYHLHSSINENHPWASVGESSELWASGAFTIHSRWVKWSRLHWAAHSLYTRLAVIASLNVQAYLAANRVRIVSV